MWHIFKEDDLNTIFCHKKEWYQMEHYDVDHWQLKYKEIVFKYCETIGTLYFLGKYSKKLKNIKKIIN